MRVEYSNENYLNAMLLQDDVSNPCVRPLKPKQYFSLHLYFIKELKKPYFLVYESGK